MSVDSKENEELLIDDSVYYSFDRQTTSWIIDKVDCRVQTSRSKITEQVSSWSFAREVGRDIVGPTRIFSIPRRRWRWALKKLEIQLPAKNLKRVAQGIKLGRQSKIKGAEGHNQKNLKAIGREIFPETGKG